VSPGYVGDMREGGPAAYASGLDMEPAAFLHRPTGPDPGRAEPVCDLVVV
jgi:hypothetical protein